MRLAEVGEVAGVVGSVSRSARAAESWELHDLACHDTTWRVNRNAHTLWLEGGDTPGARMQYSCRKERRRGAQIASTGGLWQDLTPTHTPAASSQLERYVPSCRSTGPPCWEKRLVLELNATSTFISFAFFESSWLRRKCPLRAPFSWCPTSPKSRPRTRPCCDTWGR